MPKRKSTREHLLNTGAMIVGESGLRALTVRGLSLRAGTNTGSFVYHFGNREAFLTELSRIGEQNIAIRFDSCRSFYHPPRVSKQSKFDTLKQFYVLKAWRGYFVKRKQHGVMTIRTDDPTVATVRKFRTERAAQKYMEENAPFFSRVPFSVECVQPKEAAKAA